MLIIAVMPEDAFNEKLQVCFIKQRDGRLFRRCSKEILKSGISASDVLSIGVNLMISSKRID
jgi:hypothetical protein